MENEKQTSSDLLRDMEVIKNSIPNKNGAEVADVVATPKVSQVTAQPATRAGSYDIVDKIVAMRASSPKKRKVPVMIHLSAETNERIDQLAKKTKTSKSSIMDDIITTAIFGSKD